mmetsp:Transcript_3823/g.8919  ORF Transcript_3823/g.8919 Transcript_3823/m.8919 type:complete len:221 (-) Transcript_3823:76-738(-)
MRRSSSCCFSSSFSSSRLAASSGVMVRSLAAARASNMRPRTVLSYSSSYSSSSASPLLDAPSPSLPCSIRAIMSASSCALTSFLVGRMWKRPCCMRPLKASSRRSRSFSSSSRSFWRCSLKILALAMTSSMTSFLLLRSPEAASPLWFMAWMRSMRALASIRSSPSPSPSSSSKPFSRMRRSKASMSSSFSSTALSDWPRCVSSILFRLFACAPSVSLRS